MINQDVKVMNSEVKFGTFSALACALRNEFEVSRIFHATLLEETNSKCSLLDVLYWNYLRCSIEAGSSQVS